MCVYIYIYTHTPIYVYIYIYTHTHHVYMLFVWLIAVLFVSLSMFVLLYRFCTNWEEKMDQAEYCTGGGQTPLEPLRGSKGF